MSEKITKVITDAQDILARYIVPDSGISDHECINQLLGLLDGSQTREALSAPSARGMISVPEQRLRDLLDSAERGLKNLVAAEIRGILLGSPASEPPSAMEKP